MLYSKCKEHSQEYISAEDVVPISIPSDDFCPSLLWSAFKGFFWMLWFTKFFTYRFGYVQMRTERVSSREEEALRLGETKGFKTFVVHRALNAELTEMLYQKCVNEKTTIGSILLAVLQIILSQQVANSIPQEQVRKYYLWSGCVVDMRRMGAVLLRDFRPNNPGLFSSNTKLAILLN